MNQIEKNSERKVSVTQLFQIFIKTGRKRIILTLICGIIIFLVVISFSMLVYTYRFNFFNNQMNKEINGKDDRTFSAAAQKLYTGTFSFSENFYLDIVNDFSSQLTQYIPNVEITGFSFGMSVQIYEYDPWIPGPEKFINHEILAVDAAVFSSLEKYIIDGRMPENSSELLIYSTGEESYGLTDIVRLFPADSVSTTPAFYNATGLVRFPNVFPTNETFSRDLFGWNIAGLTWFMSYIRGTTFITSFNYLRQLASSINNYYGLITYLTDFDYDLTAINLGNINHYITILPTTKDYPTSTILNRPIVLSLDLRRELVVFAETWVEETIDLLILNIPIFLIIGVIVVTILNIGAEELDTSFRRMKLHGLSYKTMRTMVFLENIGLVFISLFGGVSLGISINFLITLGVENRPWNFYSGFFIEPLLYMLIGAFFLCFFTISFIIQNTIAKKSTSTVSEEYKTRRTKIKNLLSSNEFKLFVIALLFSLLSFGIYIIYQNFGAEVNISSNIPYVTVFLFMISVSASFIITFVFLMIARLFSLLWSLLSRITWRRSYNFFTLAFKQLAESKKTYQLALFVSLIFGLLVLPCALINISVNNHLTNEAFYNLGGSSLAIIDWLDPEDEQDVILDNIEEIANYSEVTIHKVVLTYEAEVESRGYKVNFVALDNPDQFLATMDTSNLGRDTWTKEDVSALKTYGNILVDKKFARKAKLGEGDQFLITEVTRHINNVNIVSTFKKFPLAPLPKKGLFENYIVAYTVIGSSATIKEITQDIDFRAFDYTTTYKLIKSVNSSVNSIIKEELAGFNIYDQSDLTTELQSNINAFHRNNVIFYGYLIFGLVLFISYFTGLRTYQERLRIVESLYRAGADKRQILGLFLVEYMLTNLIPILIAMLLSIPAIRILAIYSLQVQEEFVNYRAGIPVWLFILMLLAGLVISAAGWIGATTPLLLKYRPTKQE